MCFSGYEIRRGTGTGICRLLCYYQKVERLRCVRRKLAVSIFVFELFLINWNFTNFDVLFVTWFHNRKHKWVYIVLGCRNKFWFYERREWPAIFSSPLSPKNYPYFINFIFFNNGFLLTYLWCTPWKGILSRQN